MRNSVDRLAPLAPLQFHWNEEGISLTSRAAAGEGMLRSKSVLTLRSRRILRTSRSYRGGTMSSNELMPSASPITPNTPPSISSQRARATIEIELSTMPSWNAASAV
jgi:hypothetical protein